MAAIDEKLAGYERNDNVYIVSSYSFSWKVLHENTIYLSVHVVKPIIPISNTPYSNHYSINGSTCSTAINLPT